jgi:hypothetical protein
MNRLSLSSLASRALLLAGTAATLLSASVAMGQEATPYPTAIIHRPLTLPGGMMELTASAQRAVFLGFDASSIGLAARYGISQRLEFGVGSGLGIDPDIEWSKGLSLGAGFTVLDTVPFDLALRVDIPLDFHKNAEVLNTVILGADTRLQLTPKLALRAGHGLLQVRTDPSYTTIDGNVAVEVQVSPQFGVGFGTRLFSVQLTGGGDYGNSIVDIFPFKLYGLFAVNHALDIFASFSTLDTGAMGDFNVAQAGINVRL